jgi:hypothetical protein
LLAWAAILSETKISAWRAQDSGHRYLEVEADHRRAPVRGHVAAVLNCDNHLAFWTECRLEDLEAGESRRLTTGDLARAWETMPVTPPGEAAPPHAPTPDR